MGYSKEQEKELYFANAVIGAINNVKVPMLMYEEEKEVGFVLDRIGWRGKRVVDQFNYVKFLNEGKYD